MHKQPNPPPHLSSKKKKNILHSEIEGSNRVHTHR